MKDEVLLFHGLPVTTGCGCSGTGRRKKTMARRYNPYTRVSVRKRSRRRRSFRGSLAGFGQTTTIRQSLGSVKEIIYVGAIAGAGAIATDWVYDKIGAKFNLQNEMLALAKIATGIALGIVIAKVLKKPRIGIAFAMGPVVVGVKDMLKGAVGLAGIPYASDPNAFQRAITRAPFAGVPAIGPGVPDWMDVEKTPSWNYA